MGFNHKKEVEYKKRLLESLNKVIALKDPVPESLGLFHKRITRIKSQLEAEMVSVKSEAAAEQVVDSAKAVETQEAPLSEFAVFADHFQLLMRVLEQAKKGKDKEHNIVRTLDLLINLNDFKAYCFETPYAEIFRLLHLAALTALCEMKIPKECVEFANAQKYLITLKQQFDREGYFQMNTIFDLIGKARDAALRETKAPRNFPFLSDLTNLPFSCLKTVAAALEKKQDELKKMESKYEELFTHFQRKTGELLALLNTPKQGEKANEGATSLHLPDLISRVHEKLAADQHELGVLKEKIDAEKKERERLENLEREAREELIRKDQEEAVKRRALEAQKAQLETQVRKKTQQLQASRIETQTWKEKFDEISEVVEASDDGRTKTLIREVRNGTVTSTRKKDLASLRPFVGGDKLRVMESLSGVTRTLALSPEETLRLEKQILRMYFSSPGQSAKVVLGADKRWKKYSAKQLNGHYQFLVTAFDGVKPWLSAAVESRADLIVDMDARVTAMRRLISKEDGIFRQMTVEKFDHFLGKRQLAELATMLNPDLVEVLKIMHEGCQRLSKPECYTVEKRMLELCRLNSTSSVKEYLVPKELDDKKTCRYYKGYKDGEFEARKVGFLTPIYEKIDAYINKAYKDVRGERDQAVEKAQFIQSLIGKSGLFSRCNSGDFQRNFGRLLAEQAADEASSSSVQASVVENK